MDNLSIAVSVTSLVVNFILIIGVAVHLERRFSRIEFLVCRCCESLGISTTTL